MEQVVPWPLLCGVIEPYYPKAGRGRPPVALATMLRIAILRFALIESAFGLETGSAAFGLDVRSQTLADSWTLLRCDNGPGYLSNVHGLRKSDSLGRNLTA
jgi:IS5 family transposase